MNPEYNKNPGVGDYNIPSMNKFEPRDTSQDSTNYTSTTFYKQHMENSSYYRFKNSTTLGLGPAGYEFDKIEPDPKMYTMAYKTKDP